MPILQGFLRALVFMVEYQLIDIIGFYKVVCMAGLLPFVQS